MQKNSDVEQKWLEAVGLLGTEIEKKGMGDLLVELFLVSVHLPMISPELREKAELHIKLQTLREALNEREQRVALGFKILKEKGLL